jgi:hypothetical protein
MAGKRAVIVTMLIALFGVGAFAWYVKTTPGASRVADDMRRTDHTSRPGPHVNVDVKPKEDAHVQTAYLVPTVSGMDVKLDKKAPAVPEGQDARVFLVTQTFSSLGVADGRAVGIELNGKNAVVDVNQSVLDHGYGSMEEGQLVKALQMALGQFPEVDTFQLRTDGQIIDSLGHLELTDPIPVSRPGAQPEPTTPSEG